MARHVARPVMFRLPEGHTATIFVRRGEVEVGGGAASSQPAQTVAAHAVALMEAEGTVLRLTAREQDTQVLVLGGAPIKEPSELSLLHWTAPCHSWRLLNV
jgi:redox-sensitive bicupin YhaK (pirin superfamily)